MTERQGPISTARGRPFPFGCTADGAGLNFAVFSRHAERMELVLFASTARHYEPGVRIDLDPRCNRTGDVWHVRLHGVEEDTTYAWRADGPLDPQRGFRFDGRELLLDPCATALAGHGRSASGPTDQSMDRPRCLVPRLGPFDWQGDCAIRHDWSRTVIYETHVRGLTIDASSGVKHSGTFLGVVEKIPHLVRLGITALELMPVQEFLSVPLVHSPSASMGREVDYWGYNPVAFFAPKESYSTRVSPGCQIDEFKTMVRELHKAGIEVILDVVFNHTGEGDHNGPMLNYRGLDNGLYYLLDPADPSRYLDYSGCGNTLNCGHPVVRDHVLDCLRYWASEMHVDGFRFDLASVLGRGPGGRLLADPPLIERIAEDPVLRGVKLIAEAWDAGGAYQVGSFPSNRWSEWNGRFRDDVRRFWRGDPGMAGALASRLCGSADLYHQAGKRPLNSINFVTCHDGFTLNDLVSYARKHNEANGEGNRDGADENFSTNHGIEGETDDPAIRAVRLRHIKNLLATLMLSRGVPLLLGGDEFRRTQRGNNNAYCQDNAVSWYDWRRLDEHRELFGFTAGVVALRNRHDVLRTMSFYEEDEVIWFDAEGGTPDWHGPTRELGCAIRGTEGTPVLCLLFNPSADAVTFRLHGSVAGYRWLVAVDTSTVAHVPHRHQRSESCRLIGRSLVVLEHPDSAEMVRPTTSC